MRDGVESTVVCAGWDTANGSDGLMEPNWESDTMASMDHTVDLAATRYPELDADSFEHSKP